MIFRAIAGLAIFWIAPLFAVQATAQDLIIENARLAYADDDSELVKISVTDGRITDVSPDLTAQDSTRRVDAAGNFVTPALMNSMTQLGLIELFSVNETRDSSGDEHDLGAAFDVQYGLNENSILVDIARQEGLGWAVTLPDGGNGKFTGLGAILHLRTDGSILHKSHAGLVFRSGEMTGGSRAAGWTALHDALSDGDAEAPVTEVLAGTVPLIITASRESDIAQAIAIREKYGIRIILIGGEEAWRLAPELAAADIPVVLVPHNHLPSSYDTIGVRADNAALLHEAGVSIAFCADSIFVSHNAGNAMRVGAGIATAYGLDRQAALDAMTRNPARIWGVEAGYGAIQAGKSADLVIWSGDPLEALTQPVAVYIAGEAVTNASRHQLLRETYLPETAR